MKFLIFVLIIISLLGSSGCMSSGSVTVTVEQKIPDRFISLDDAISNSQLVEEYVFFETQIALMSKKGCIYQTNINNRDFIVCVDGDYYISEDIFWKLHNPKALNKNTE